MHRRIVRAANKRGKFVRVVCDGLGAALLERIISRQSAAHTGVDIFAKRFPNLVAAAFVDQKFCVLQQHLGHVSDYFAVVLKAQQLFVPIEVDENYQASNSTSPRI